MAKKEKIVENKAPAIYAYSKKIMPTNALMFSCDWGSKDKKDTIKIGTKTILGTQSQRKGEGKTANEGNIQSLNFATLPLYHDTLVVKYNVKFLGGVFKPELCGDMEYADIVANGLKDVDFKTLAYRYIYNIAAARPLWRNSVPAEKIETAITIKGQKFVFYSYTLNLQDFDNNEDVDTISDMVVDVWKNSETFVLLAVEHFSLLGHGMEVYPSEEKIDRLDEKDSQGNKKHELSKILFNLNGQAAIHDQKLGNAIRTIDDWYNNAEKPIAVEPYGSVVREGKAFRVGNKTDFYTLLTSLVKGESMTEEEKLYITAVLIRGGVFGEK